MITESQLLPALERIVEATQSTLRSEQRKSLLQYALLVAEWDPKVDLTGAKTAADLADILFADVLNLLKTNWMDEGFVFVDVGTGVGVPGIVLGILRPDCEGYLVEPRKKRCVFLRLATQRLGLQPRIRVIENRIDPKHPAKILEALAAQPTYALSRATFAPPLWLQLGKQLASKVVVFATEQQQIQQVPQATYPYQLPHGGSHRTLLLYSFSSLWETRVSPSLS